jgi:hypothetical protein
MKDEKVDWNSSGKRRRPYFAIGVSMRDVNLLGEVEICPWWRVGKANRCNDWFVLKVGLLDDKKDKIEREGDLPNVFNDAWGERKVLSVTKVSFVSFVGNAQYIENRT